MLSIEALKAYGADTRAGVARCLNDERFYLGLVEMLMYDDRFDILTRAVEIMDMPQALHAAYALSETATSLALRPLADQIDQMILCLHVRGDSAVLDKQLRLIQMGLDELRTIDMD